MAKERCGECRRLPGLLFVESIRQRFSVVTLSEKEYYEVIAAAAERGIGGGKIYDALILRCAEKSRSPERKSSSLGTRKISATWHPASWRRGSEHQNTVTISKEIVSDVHASFLRNPA